MIHEPRPSSMTNTSVCVEHLPNEANVLAALMTSLNNSSSLDVRLSLVIFEVASRGTDSPGPRVVRLLHVFLLSYDSLRW